MMPPKSRKKQRPVPLLPIESGPSPSKPLPVIKVVGVSGSGKSTLVAALRTKGYDARPVSQEHSNVPDLWQHFDRPTYLIFLYASLEAQRARRCDVEWSIAAHEEELRRLAHAREHADIRIDTDQLTGDAVFAVAQAYLVQHRVHHATSALNRIQATGSAIRPDQ
jgi:hypothetical protein